MSQSNKKPVSLIVGAVATGALVAGSLFSMQAMASGYMQDAAKTETKAAEGKCGEGKCGEGKCGGHEAKRDAASGQASGKRQHHTLADMDTDKDGRMSRAEFNAAHRNPGNVTAMDDWEKHNAKQFAAHDGDGDGFITQAEMDKHHADMKATGDGKAKTEGKCGEGKCGEGKCGGNP